jgi:hypothetical protein
MYVNIDNIDRVIPVTGGMFEVACRDESSKKIAVTPDELKTFYSLTDISDAKHSVDAIRLQDLCSVISRDSRLAFFK